VFSFGVNDCLHDNGRPRVSTDVSVANTRTILSRASAIWPTLMIGPPFTGDASLDRLVLNQFDQMDLVCREFPALLNDARQATMAARGRAGRWDLSRLGRLSADRERSVHVARLEKLDRLKPCAPVGVGWPKADRPLWSGRKREADDCCRFPIDSLRPLQVIRQPAHEAAATRP